MSSHAVADRYAEALFELARNAGALDDVTQSLMGVRTSFQASDDLRKTYFGRGISADRKHAVVKENLTPNRHALVGNLLHVLVKNGREDIFLPIVLAFVEKVESAQGMLRLTVETAAPLDEAGQQGLVQRLSEATGKKVVADFVVLPELIAGIRLRAESRLIDGSARRRLDRLRVKLKAAS